MAEVFSSVASVGIQKSNAIPPHIAAPLIHLMEEDRPLATEFFGFGNLQRSILNIQNNDPSKYNSASGSRGLEYFDKLGVPFPKKARFVEEEEAKVITNQDVPDEYKCVTGYSHTIATTGKLRIAPPGELIPVNGVYRFLDDAGELLTIIVMESNPESDNGVEITYKVIDGDVGGSLANSAGSETKLALVGVYNTETGRITKQKYRFPTVSLYGMSIIETPIEISSKSLITKFDTEDKMAIAVATRLAQNTYVAKQINNVFAFAPNVLSTTTKAGNTLKIVPGITEMPGIGYTDADGVGIGPTIIENVLATISKQVCKAVQFNRSGKRIVLDAFFGMDIAMLFNSMLSTGAAPFGTSLQTKFGEDSYDKNLRVWKGITADLRLFYDRTFDNAFLKKKILVGNSNAGIPIFKKDQYMRIALSPADTTHKVQTHVVTNELGILPLIPGHFHVIDNVTVLES